MAFTLRHMIAPTFTRDATPSDLASRLRKMVNDMREMEMRAVNQTPQPSLSHARDDRPAFGKRR